MKRERTSTTAARGAWSYSSGQWGRNRVRVFEHRSAIWIDYQAESGGRVRHSLGHCDRSRARREADEIAAKFGRAEQRPTTALTLSRLFEIYEREITPTKSASAQGHDRRSMPLFLKAFGASRRPETLNVRDWNSFIERRRHGELAHEGREGRTVRNRIIEQDLKLLLAILNFAVRARDDAGGYLLDRNR